MTSINLPGPGVLLTTARAYAIDLAERVLATFVVSAAGVAVAAGPADMFHASFWETVGAAGLAAAGSLTKGVLARAVGDKNSASLTN
jgi:hypothetical protein